MPPKRTQPGPEQGTIPGLEQAPATVIRQFDKRAAFGRIPKPEFSGINPEELKSQIDENDLQHVSPDYLAGVLFSDTEGSYKGVLFRPDEREVIVRNHPAFGRAIIDRALRRGAVDHNIDRRNARAQRSGVHALESKIKPTGNMLKGYEQEIDSLTKLRKELKSPGYAHMSEVDLRILASNARNSFRNMVEVVGLRQGWDGEAVKRALKALDYSIGSESYKPSFSYWAKMLNLASNYANARWRIVRLNHKITQNRIEDNI